MGWTTVSLIVGKTNSNCLGKDWKPHLYVYIHGNGGAGDIKEERRGMAEFEGDAAHSEFSKKKDIDVDIAGMPICTD